MESPSISRHLPQQSSHARSPLSISTNSSPTPPLPATSSPVHLPLPQGRRIRRKASLSYKKKDSSEEIPSSDGSGIYNARTYSQSNSSENYAAVTTWENWDSNGSISVGIIGRTPIIYGNCTPLDTISEKNSNSTLKTLTHSISVDALSRKHSRPALDHQESPEISHVQRQRSFSLDDLTNTRLSYHDTGSSIVRVDSGQPQRHLEKIVQPQKPLLAPPVRPVTPPGMPSWTARQERRIPPRTSSNRRDRILSWWHVVPRIQEPTIPPTGNTAATTGPRASLPRGVTTTPRYRPPRSTYVSIDSHPFSRLPTPISASPREPRPTWGGITLTTGWSLDSEPAPPLQEEGFGRMNVGGCTVTTCTSRAVPMIPASLKKLSCPHPRHHPPHPTNITNVTHENYSSPLQDTNHSHGPLPTPKRLHAIAEDDPVLPALTSDPDGTTCHDYHPPHAAIPGDGPSLVPLSACSTLRPDYLVLVTNLEEPRRRDLCWRCYIGAYLHDFGVWIDRHGENFDLFVDRAARKTCVLCCGIAAGPEGEEEVGGGGGGGRSRLDRRGRGAPASASHEVPPRLVSLAVDIPSGRFS